MLLYASLPTAAENDKISLTQPGRRILTRVAGSGNLTPADGGNVPFRKDTGAEETSELLKSKATTSRRTPQMVAAT